MTLGGAAQVAAAPNE